MTCADFLYVNQDGTETKDSPNAAAFSFRRGLGLLCADMTQAELRRLARLGAEARLQELQREAEAIRAAFPGLRSRRVVPKNGDIPTEQTSAPKRRRRRMSAAGRKRIAEAAKRRWAKWRAKQSGTKGTS